MIDAATALVLAGTAMQAAPATHRIIISLRPSSRRQAIGDALREAIPTAAPDVALDDLISAADAALRGTCR